MANSHDSTGREGQPSGGPNGQSAAKGFLSNAQVLWCPTPRMGGLNPRIVVDSSQQEPSISDRVQDQPITIAGTFFFLPPPLQFPLSESPLLCPLPLIYFESQCSSFQTLRMRLHCFRRFASIERGRAFLASTVPPLSFCFWQDHKISQSRVHRHIHTLFQVSCARWISFLLLGLL